MDPMADQGQLPSLQLLSERVMAERETMRAHGEGLDTKAGVVLGFSGVLVGLGATAQPVVSASLPFRFGLGIALVGALLAALSFLLRRYPVLEVHELREECLTAPEEETRLELLDTELDMVRRSAELLQFKGRFIQMSVVCLLAAVALVVVGTLVSGGLEHV